MCICYAILREIILIIIVRYLLIGRSLTLQVFRLLFSKSLPQLCVIYFFISFTISGFSSFFGLFRLLCPSISLIIFIFLSLYVLLKKLVYKFNGIEPHSKNRFLIVTFKDYMSKSNFGKIFTRLSRFLHFCTFKQHISKRNVEFLWNKPTA